MPAATRLGDLCTGHDCWPPRPSAQGSPDVFVNNIPWHRQTDNWEVHWWPPPWHGGVLVTGSPTVYVNGLQGGRIGDPVSCGSFVMTGSSNVFCDETGTSM